MTVKPACIPRWQQWMGLCVGLLQAVLCVGRKPSRVACHSGFVRRLWQATGVLFLNEMLIAEMLPTERARLWSSAEERSDMREGAFRLYRDVDAK